MSSELGLADLYDIMNSKNSSNFYPLSIDGLDECNISSIKINSPYANYHFICKRCKEIPTIVCFKKNNIKLMCSCSDSPKEILMKNIFDYLKESKDENKIPKKFRCSKHNEKNIFYCRKCDKNCCQKCINDCVEEKHEIQFFKYDIQTIHTINIQYQVGMDI